MEMMPEPRRQHRADRRLDPFGVDLRTLLVVDDHVAGIDEPTSREIDAVLGTVVRGSAIELTADRCRRSAWTRTVR